MKESYGTSSSGNLKEAVRGLGNPAFLILMSNAEQLGRIISGCTEHWMHRNELPDRCDGKRCQCNSV